MMFPSATAAFGKQWRSMAGITTIYLWQHTGDEFVFSFGLFMTSVDNKKDNKPCQSDLLRSEAVQRVCGIIRANQGVHFLTSPLCKHGSAAGSTQVNVTHEAE